MFLDDRNNYCKQAKYILSRIIPPQLKFSKRQNHYYTHVCKCKPIRQTTNHTKIIII